MFLSHFVGDARCMLDSRQMKLVILYALVQEKDLMSVNEITVPNSKSSFYCCTKFYFTNSRCGM